jgi:hypothetical protein
MAQATEPSCTAATSCLFVSKVPIFAELPAPLTDLTASRANGAPSVTTQSTLLS